MSLEQGAAIRAVPRLRINLWLLLSYLAIGLVALLPRVLDLGRFITDDEANFWLLRSDLFLRAIRSGGYADTAMTAHPGVTTMWLGAAGIVLRHALLDWGVLRSDAFPVVLAFFRLPVVLAHVAVILLGYGLLRRMLPAALALLAALLWAADPFVIGYSRLLHTDALSGSFMTLSLLAACCYWNHQRRPAWLILSGASAGLALLSKWPALALLPAVGLIALLAMTKDPFDYAVPSSIEGQGRQGPRTMDQGPTMIRPSSFVFGLWSAILPVLAWSAIAALTVFALWPALWVSPLRAYEQLRIGVEIEGAQPHMLGNFFLGRQDDAPGLLFYPVALALRTTPWTLLGLLLLPIVWRRLQVLAPARRDLAGLAGFAILFVAAMSLFPKKFDRYMVPAFPTLDILAAAGILGIADCRLQIADFRLLPSQIQKLKSHILMLAVGLLSLLNVVYWHPYSTLAFNQALGGTRAGARTFTMGWGEGLEQAAAWLNEQPDITSVRTVAVRITSLNPYLRDGAQADFPKGEQLRDHTGYVVVYLPQVQPGRAEGVFGQFYGRRTPLHTIRIHDVDFAWIYQAPPQVAQPRAAGFGSDIRLRGFDQRGEPRRGQALSFHLSWETTVTPRQDYWLFAHVIGPGGQRVAQIDVPYPTSQWAPGRFATTELPIALPADAPAGAYRLLIGLYDQASGRRLALTTADQGAADASDTDALLLTHFELK